MYKDFGDRAAFLVVYIEEAHASDMWQLPSNLKDGVIFASPKDFEERDRLASTCVRKLGIEIPAVVDGLANTVERAYTAWPDRLYVISKDGRVVYKSGPGPFGFEPSEAKAALERELHTSTARP